MFKKILWVAPVLSIGIAIGGLAFPHVFAATGNYSKDQTDGYAQAQQMMQSAWNNPQGRNMIQSCENFMNQSSSQK